MKETEGWQGIHHNEEKEQRRDIRHHSGSHRHESEDFNV